MAKRRSVGLLLFLLVGGIYLLTAGGHLYERDGVSLFFMAEGLAREGIPAIPLNPNTQGGKIGLDGRYYSPYGLGQPLAVLPLYGIGRWLTETTSYKYAAAMAVSFFNSFVTALTAVVLLFLLLELGYSRRTSIMLGLLFSVATLAWPYARFFYSEPLVSLGQLGAILAILRGARVSEPEASRTRWFFLAGCSLGWAILTRPVTVVVLPVYAILAVIQARRWGNGGWFCRILGFGLAVGLACLAVGLYNYGRFGNPFDQGYGPLPTGLPQRFDYPWLRGIAVLLVSPGKGLFVYSPILLVAMAGIPRFCRRQRSIAAVTLAIPVILLMLYAHWCQLEGGYSWGPRFMLPAIPLLLLPLAEVLERITLRSSRFAAAGVIAMVMLSEVIQLPAVAVNVMEVIEANPAAYYEAASGRYNPAYSPLPRAWQLAWEAVTGTKRVMPGFESTVTARKDLYVINLHWSGEIDFWWVHLISDGIPKGPILAIVMLLTGIPAVAGIGLIWSAVQANSE